MQRFAIETSKLTPAQTRFHMLKMEDTFREQVLGMASTLVSLVDLRDCYTGGHSTRVAIVQTGPPVNVVGLLSALGGGTLLDQVPGTSIYLLDLPNLPVITPCWKRFLALGSSSRTGTLSIPHAARWTF
jgi:hypothetical protein